MFARRSNSVETAITQSKTSLLSRFKSKKALSVGLLGTCMTLAAFGWQYSKDARPQKDTTGSIATVQNYPTTIALPFENKTMYPENDSVFRPVLWRPIARLAPLYTV